MNLFNVDFKKVLFALFVVALPIMSFNMQRRPGEAPWYIRPFSLAADLIQTGISEFSSGVRGTTGLYLDLLNVKSDNRILKKKNAELRAQLARFHELNLENQRLTELLNFKQQTNMKLLAAEVTGLDLIRDHNTIFINRGTHHGLKAGMPVVTTEGVVGYVFRPHVFSAQVLLLTDRYAVIDGVVQRSRARGLVEGESRETCTLQNLGRTDDVQEGDLVVTSGLDRIFPKGFPIAVVTSVIKNNYGVSQEVKLRPVVSAYRLDEVFVILEPTEEEWRGLSTQPPGPPVGAAANTPETDKDAISQRKEPNR